MERIGQILRAICSELKFFVMGSFRLKYVNKPYSTVQEVLEIVYAIFRDYLQ